MKAANGKVMGSGGTETRTDSTFACLQQEGLEEVKMSERRKRRDFQTCRWRFSLREIILSVVIAILLLVICALSSFVCDRSPVKEAQQQPCDTDVPAPCVPACPPYWIGYEGKCYFFSKGGRNWTSGQSFCASYNSSLAVIENEQEKEFITRYKCSADHWIGLRKDPDHNWKWADGTELNGTLELKGEGGDCAFLNSGAAVSSRCHIQRNWICSHHDAYESHKHSSIRR